MLEGFDQIAFTTAVKAEQEKAGSRSAYARREPAQAGIALGPDEAAFIAARDSFYMATVSETGWPYVQHRGGAAGFLTVTEPGTIAFADYQGNRQYISKGNLAGDPRVSLILMDYPNQQRLKILGRAKVMPWADVDDALRKAVHPPDRKGKPERVIVIEVAGFDWNCPQHVTQRFTLAEVTEIVTPLRERIAELERADSPFKRPSLP